MKWHTNKLWLISLDILVIIMSFFLALGLKYDFEIPMFQVEFFMRNVVVYVIIKIVIHKLFSLYDSIWLYASIEEMMRIVAAVLISNTIGIFYMVLQNSTLSLSVYIICLMVEMSGILGIRVSYRIIRRIKNFGWHFHKSDFKNVLIIGAGSTATMIAKEMKERPFLHGHLVGFIEDDDESLGQFINGVRILGNRFDIYSVSKRYEVDEIILAIPGKDAHLTREILLESSKCGCKVKTVPGIQEIIDGKVSVQHIRDIEIEDLLGRSPVELDMTGINSYLKDKVVMVTGGGGSIGSELCRQISLFQPKLIIVLDNYENNAYDITNEILRFHHSRVNILPLIANVQDEKNMMTIFSQYRPQVVFHAAAHKHVPLMEAVPREAILNNCFGTLSVLKAADKFHVERFVFISSDKAVNPTNVMGATKRIAEMIVQSMSQKSDTIFTTVRFGNVLDSNGSVVPLFKKQIRAGGPVTVTHKDIIRYFMTIPEAVQLVLQSGAFAVGGEVFVLDMGKPVKIYDLAVNLIRLSGFEPEKDIEISIIGLRPGEKLYEELLLKEEGLEKTANKKIYIGKVKDVEPKMLNKSLEILKDVANSCSADEIKEALKNLVPTYHNESEFDDRLIIPIKSQDVNRLNQ
ncbi:MAG: polysaccharide biosynthesis protein [Clostridiales bacterium]|nr:polysaccharide biosynthesis protein [Clostridiales bacterium]